MKQWLVSVGAIVALSACGAPGGRGGPPSDACPTGKAVVTLTYDDGLRSQIANAVPALDAQDFKGTFFVNDIADNPDPWKRVVRKGHELGAHTINHPCTAEFDWVREGMASEDYDLGRMAAELDHQLSQLRYLGQKPPFVFAYPCGTDWVGQAHTPYVNLVKERFSAARGVEDRLVRPEDSKLNVPAYFIQGPAQALIDTVSAAMEKKAWVVLGFHGVGGDHLSVTTQDHQILVDWLAAHREQVAVLPFGQAAACRL
jgi:peptidoglycan/xylan/chitin deacetylase (PgdA/CDA1 family)